MRNVEFEHAYCVLRFPSLIFEILQLQKNILEKDEVLKILRKPIRISYKVLVGNHAKDVEEKVEQATPTWKSPILVTENVAIDHANNIKLFRFCPMNYASLKDKTRDCYRK